MKRILIVLLVCCLVCALAAGCGKKAEAPAEGAAAAEGGAEAVETPSVETTDIVRLESIDYDESTKGLLLNLTKGTFSPSTTTEEESDYTITYGDTVKLPLSPDAKIDFPMAEDLTKSVTLTAEELTTEYLAYMEQFDNKPLFTMEQDGDMVKTLTYFYLP